jgi:transposase
VKLMAALRATGSLEAKPEGGWRYSKLDPHRDFLIRRVAEQDDITMPELAVELVGQGTVVAPSSISRWLIRNAYRFKKNAAGQRAGSSRRRSRAPGLGRPPAEDAA